MVGEEATGLCDAPGGLRTGAIGETPGGGAALAVDNESLGEMRRAGERGGLVGECGVSFSVGGKAFAGVSDFMRGARDSGKGGC